MKNHKIVGRCTRIRIERGRDNAVETFELVHDGRNIGGDEAYYCIYVYNTIHQCGFMKHKGSEGEMHKIMDDLAEMARLENIDFYERKSGEES